MSPPGRRTEIERRSSRRAPVVVRVEYSTVDDFFCEFSQNINEGGVFIETDRPAPLDSMVQLQFRLPGSDEPVKAAGRVAHVVGPDAGEPPGMGIEFDELSPEARAQIDRLVRELRVRPEED